MSPTEPILNTAEDPDFPKSAETLYPEVAGERIPFKALPDCSFSYYTNLGDTLVILRSAEDVSAAAEDPQIMGLEVDSEAYNELLQINYDLYAVLSFTVKSSGVGSARVTTPSKK